MEDNLKSLEKNIKLVCGRPGMYTGDTTLASLQIYIQGMFHGMDICGSCTFNDWRNYIYKNYSPNKEGSWVEVLLNNFGTEAKVIGALPSLIKDFAKDYSSTA